MLADKASASWGLSPCEAEVDSGRLRDQFFTLSRQVHTRHMVVWVCEPVSVFSRPVSSSRVLLSVSTPNATLRA